MPRDPPRSLLESARPPPPPSATQPTHQRRRARCTAAPPPTPQQTAPHFVHFSLATAPQFTHAASSFGGGGGSCSTSSTSLARRRTGGPRLPSSAMTRCLPSRPGGTSVPRALFLRRRTRARPEGAMRGAQARRSEGVMVGGGRLGGVSGCSAKAISTIGALAI